MNNAATERLWDERAAHFGDWGAPLRPPPEDLALYARFVGSRFADRGKVVNTLLMGVTPELAELDWPVPLDLTAVDQSAPMVRRVWPGDVPGLRRAIVGDWMQWQPSRPLDLILTDGAPVFFADPAVLFERAHSLLANDGAFIMRTFCAPHERESVERVMADLYDGRIGNFHLFKWRIAMALQADAGQGVAQRTVHDTIAAAGIDFSKLPQPGFDARSVGTLRFYKDQTGTLHFPTCGTCEAALLHAGFAVVEHAVAGHAGGERFVVFMAAGRH
jgi:SAM-dependent methyltransferase